MSVAAHRLRRLDQVDASGGGFAPTDITGCIGWYDASDAGSFTYHSGTRVSQWDDLSGQGNHLIQPTLGGVAPNRTGTQNGLPVVDLDGFYYMYCTDLDPYFTGEVDLTVVCVYDSGSAPAGFPFGSNNGSTRRGVAAFRSSSTIIGARFRNVAAVRDRTISVSGDGWRTLIFTGDASSTTNRIPTIRVNGDASGAGAETTGSASAADGGFALGVRSASTPSSGCDGAIAEFIVYDNIISGTDITALESYLQAKWATW